MRRYSSLPFGRNRTFLPDVHDISAIRAPEEADLDLGEARRKHIRDQNKKELVNRKSLLKGGVTASGHTELTPGVFRREDEMPFGRKGAKGNPTPSGMEKLKASPLTQCPL